MQSIKLAIATIVVAVSATACCCNPFDCIPQVGLSQVAAADRTKLPELVDVPDHVQTASQKF